MASVKTCGGCKQVKPMEEFHRDARRADGRGSRCRGCVAEDKRRYRSDNAEAIAVRRRKSRQDNQEAIAERKRQYQAANRKAIRARKQAHYAATREQQLEQKRQHRAENLGQEREQDRLYHARARATVLAHYGETCACCGTSDQLTIDHVNGNGAQHRTELFGDPRSWKVTEFYRWVAENGFPDDLQTLCLSCNSSKGAGARCRLDHGEG